MMNRALCLTLVSICFLGVASGAALEAEFRDPPNAARAWVYWTQSGDYSLQSATADLEAIKQSGLGGVLRMDCSVGQVQHDPPFLSEPWRKQFVHCVHECERLGLQLAAITGPGWSGTGGPWIEAEQSMQHLIPATLNTKGPAQFDQVLPMPQPRVSRYHSRQTPRIKQQIGEFYRDIAVFAFPRREPVIADIREKALHIRNPFTSMKGVRPRLPSPADYPELNETQAIDPQSIVDLTDKLQADGTLRWDVPPGEWTIVRLGVRSTGANTRPAPTAGLGLESNKFSKEAIATHFENYFDPLLKAIGPRPKDRKTGFVALDADSWEMSSQNWTPGFRQEFKKRCGYDPWLYFTTYTGCVVGSREETERFLWDVRKTCQELLLENHAAELRKLCHARGLRLMMEPYDMNPAGDLDLGSYADFPAGEFWHTGFQSAWSCIEAASIGHTMGKPIVLAEAFTSIGNWERSPWVLKNQGDWAFAIGINKFSFHGYAHQANEDAPGNTFGPYGVFWNRKQTFWPLVGGYHDYLARCSHLLQQGVTVADILYLTPEGVPQIFQAPSSALHGADSRLPDKKGYSFDGCSPRILMDRAEVCDGRVAFPGGTSYRLLVMPRWKTMTPELLEKIIELVQSGATVLGAPPVASPSLRNYPQCDQRVKQLAEQLWGEPGSSERQLGKGRVIWDPAARNGSPAPSLLPGRGKWVWLNEGNPAQDAPAGSFHFRYTFDVPDTRMLQSAVIEATADNSLALKVNGEPMFSSENWEHIDRAELLPKLHNGKNTIEVVVGNSPSTERNPAGFLAALRLRFRDGTSRVIGSDRTWNASHNAADWSPAKELGPGTMAPWSLKARNDGPKPPLYPDYAVTSAVLAGMGVPEDFSADAPLRYTHRRTPTEDIYFVANTTPGQVAADCTFRVKQRAPQLWDAVTGTTRALPQFTHRAKTTVVPLEFAPHQSFFVVFRRAEQQRARTGANFPHLKTFATLEGPWEVAFDPEWGGPASISFPSLQDWSQRPEAGIKHYSGIATYRKTFDLPAGVNEDLYLDLGTVHELAEVSVNGQTLRTVWCAPWRVKLPDGLKRTGNQLEIKVANLWTNRLLGDAAKPPSERLTRATASPRISSLKPSGLLGPVTLKAASSP